MRSSLFCSVFRPISKNQWIKNLKTLFHFRAINKHLFHGKVNFVNIPQARSIDIDSKTDFKMAEILFKLQKDKNYA